MKTWLAEDVNSKIIKQIQDGTADVQNDNQGQLVIYTNIFEWEDGTFHDESEGTDET